MALVVLKDNFTVVVGLKLELGVLVVIIPCKIVLDATVMPAIHTQETCRPTRNRCKSSGTRNLHACGSVWYKFFSGTSFLIVWRQHNCIRPDLTHIQVDPTLPLSTQLRLPDVRCLEKVAASRRIGAKWWPSMAETRRRWRHSMRRRPKARTDPTRPGSALCLDPQRFHYWLPASGGRRAVDRPGGASVNVVRRPVMLWCRMSVRRTPTCGVCRPSVADCSQLRAAVTHVIVIIWEQSCCIHHRRASICYREPATYHIMIACFFLCRQQ